MNAETLARNAYATTTAAPIRSERSTEYDAFRRITTQLRRADPKSDFPGFAQALHENRKLWNLLAVDVADTSNQLPAQLRAQIFYLAEFTSIHTGKILNGAADATPLIDINTLIMTGLNASGTVS